ncbi:hypothetical protein C0993_009826, partial [Termitomyces sp. T159_Od127]
DQLHEKTAVHFCLQLTDNPSKAGATSISTAPPDGSGDPPPPRPALGAPLAFLLNILHNKYKGPKLSTSKLLAWLPSLTSFKAAPPPTFQLNISPALLEEYLDADATTSEPKTEEQILRKVVPPEYHKFANVFFKGSSKDPLPSFVFTLSSFWLD